MEHRPLIALKLLFVWGVFAVSTPAQSQTQAPKTASLSWVRLEGAESCIATQKLAQKVERLLNRSVFVSAVDAELSIEALAMPRPDSLGFSARVVVSDASGATLGVRDVATDESNCSKLDEPLVLVIALSIDPEAAFVQLPEALSPNEEHIVDPAANLLAELETETNKESDRAISNLEADKPQKLEPQKETIDKEPTSDQGDDWTFWITGGTALGIGFLPKLGFGLSLQFHMEAPWLWPLELTGLYWMPNDTKTTMGGKGEMQLVQSSLSICPLTIDLSPVTWLICGGIQIGIESASSSGYRNSNDQTFWQFGFEAYTRFYLPIAEPFGLSFGSALIVPVQTHQYKINLLEGESRSIYETSPVAARVEISGGVRFK
jgi:hypothetical protein